VGWYSATPKLPPLAETVNERLDATDDFPLVERLSSNCIKVPAFWAIYEY